MFSYSFPQIKSFKANTFQSTSQLQSFRLFIQESEIKQFWQCQSMLNMERLMCLRNEDVIKYISEYINHYLREKKTIDGIQAYFVSYPDSNRILMYIYDCKIFNSPAFLKEENDILSSFVVAWKDQALADYYSALATNQQQQELEIYEFLDSTLLGDSAAVFKCKVSCMTKIYNLVRSEVGQHIDGDTVILPQDLYFSFLFKWMYCSQSYSVEFMIKHLFRGLMVLLENSILLAFFNTLEPAEIEKRQYLHPAAIIHRPPSKETETMIQSGLGDVQWHTLKINAFKLKYKVVEDKNRYLCYRVKEDTYVQNGMGEPEYFEGLNASDRNIVLGLALARGDINMQAYGLNYYM